MTRRRRGITDPEESVYEVPEVDRRLRTYPLQAGDLVAVVGGYGGWTCGMLMDNYPGIEVYTWEPQELQYSNLLRNEGWRDNLHIFNYGLGVENGEFEMTMAGSDHCSFVHPYSPETPIAERSVTLGKLRQVEEVFAELGLLDREWALMHMNIEGYEYYLIPRLVSQGLLPQIKYLTVHIHGCPTQEPERGFLTGDAFFESIAQSHIWSWDYSLMASGWRRKDLPPIDYALYEKLRRRGCDGDTPYGARVVREDVP